MPIIALAELDGRSYFERDLCNGTRFLGDIDTNPPHSKPMHIVQVIGAGVVGNDHYPAGALAEFCQAVQHASVVIAKDTGLNQHQPVNAEPLVHRYQLRERRVRRGKGPLGH